MSQVQCQDKFTDGEYSWTNWHRYYLILSEVIYNCYEIDVKIKEHPNLKKWNRPSQAKGLYTIAAEWCMWVLDLSSLQMKFQWLLAVHWGLHVQ